MKIDDVIYNLHLDDKKKYFDSITEDQLIDMWEAKMNNVRTHFKKVESLNKEIRDLGYEAAEFYRAGYPDAADEIYEKIEKVNFERDRYQRILDAYHVEACCCFVRYMEDNNIPEEEFTAAQKREYPLYTWDMIEWFLNEKGYYVEDTDSNQNSK